MLSESVLLGGLLAMAELSQGGKSIIKYQICLPALK